MVDYENERVKNYAKPFRDQNKREKERRKEIDRDY